MAASSRYVDADTPRLDYGGGNPRPARRYSLLEGLRVHSVTITAGILIALSLEGIMLALE
jgi:hypothetical protein